MCFPNSQAFFAKPALIVNDRADKGQRDPDVEAEPAIFQFLDRVADRKQRLWDWNSEQSAAPKRIAKHAAVLGQPDIEFREAEPLGYQPAPWFSARPENGRHEVTAKVPLPDFGVSVPRDGHFDRQLVRCRRKAEKPADEGHRKRLAPGDLRNAGPAPAVQDLVQVAHLPGKRMKVLSQGLFEQR